jgi:hypothetical protein
MDLKVARETQDVVNLDFVDLLDHLVLTDYQETQDYQDQKV